MPRLLCLTAALVTLAACDAQEIGNKVLKRTVETVVHPVVSTELDGARADAATGCIVQNATQAELESLARDVAVEAGTVTKATIRGIALRPETAACFARNGVPQVKP